MIEHKKVLAIIPARGGSKGIPLKNLRTLKNKTLVEWAFHSLKQVDYIDKVVLSSDHPEIINHALEIGIDVPFTRPKELSGDDVPDLPVLQHATQASESYYETIFDYILMVQPTGPMRNPSDIRDSITKIHHEKFETVWTLSPLNPSYHPYKTIKLTGDCWQLYDHEGKNFTSRQKLEQLYRRNGACYAYTRDCLINQSNFYPKKAGYVLSKGHHVSIDTEFDLKLVEFLMDNTDLE